MHGGTLPVSERWTRDRAHAKVFGSPRPTLLGRFSLAERLGGGGMGEVYAAWDPKLERNVALKVLRAEVEFDGGAQRLEREARALASLTHPNVITIYEVGEDAGEVYIAMELVQGPNLRAWQSSSKRTCAEILEVYRQAGRGLVAAHECGLVHGDFKPENVLIDDAGRVRVADFGLAARPGGAPSSTQPSGQHSAEATAPERGTLAGGTPGYMAPELLVGSAPSPASDQYGLCVSALEALEGRRRDREDSNRAVPRIPRYVRTALSRGLQPDPAARFPSVDALLDALVPPRRTWLWASVIGLGGAAALLVVRPPTTPPCAGVAPEPWAESRSSAARAFEQASEAWVAPTWTHVDDALSQYETVLAQAHEDACRLAPRRGSVLAHKATACLDTIAGEHTALVRALGQGEPAALREAVLRTPVVLSPRACVDDEALERFVDVEDPALRSRLTAALRGYARLPGPGRAIAAKDLEAGLHADPLTQSTARALRARQALDDGDLEAAAQALQRSATLSASVGDRRGQVAALALLAFAVGQDRDRLPESEQIATQALDILDAEGEAPLLRARLLHDLASAASHARPPDHGAALRLHREAVALLEPALGPTHPLTLRAQLSLGDALARGGHPKQALELLRRISVEVASVWGPEDPTWARSNRALGLALLREGDPGESLEAFERSRQAHAARLGTHNLEVARDRYNEALALRRLSRDSDALHRLAKGLPIAEEALGPEHPELIPWLALQGRTALALERFDDAAVALRRALRLCESDGAAPKEFAKLRVALAEALLHNDPKTAQVHLTAAQEFLAKTDGFNGLRARADALAGQLRARSPRASAVPPRSR